jgi:hypothetical protein
VLYGRATERSVIDRLLADTRAGRSGVLVVRGETGIGKTALLDDAAAAAGRVAAGDAVSGGAVPGNGSPPGVAAVRVIRGAGVQSEAALPFAAVHLLLGPVLGGRARRPAVWAA